MPTLATLNDVLDQAGRLLDEAARQIRDLPLDPRSDNMGHIANALNHVLELQQQIRALQPDLKPAYLRAPSYKPNETVAWLIERARYFEGAGAVGTAVGLLQAFAAENPGTEAAVTAEQELNAIRARNGR